MSKLTKEQVKFFIETMTDDMHNTTQHEIAETLLSKFDECESLQAKLLAYEQAAKTVTAITTDEEMLHVTHGSNGQIFAECRSDDFESKGLQVIKLYAAPVLPKQPEPTISFYRDGIIAAAKWVENQRDAYDNEHGQSDPDTGAFEFGNDAQLEYSTTLSEIAEGIRSLHPASAQPVSEPYKLPSGYALVPCKLTAENGAKSCMIGEFTEQTEITCPECFGDDECETCDGSGMIEVTVPVSWTTIKDIWAKGIEHFAVAPAQEQK